MPEQTSIHSMPEPNAHLQAFQAQIQKLVGRIQQVSAPIAQCAHTKIEPAAPLAIYKILVISSLI